jgi:nitrite reductase (NADH) small subunit
MTPVTDPTTATTTLVCAANDILPNTGVCALVAGRHVAVFRVGGGVGADNFFAIDNIDPKNGASVLSRGLIGNLGDQVVVASPLYKHHFVLATGECTENPEWSVQAHPVEVREGQVWVSLA